MLINRKSTGLRAELNRIDTYAAYEKEVSVETAMPCCQRARFIQGKGVQ